MPNAEHPSLSCLVALGYATLFNIFCGPLFFLSPAALCRGATVWLLKHCSNASLCTWLMEMQCRAFVEDLLASHSTDLQQRAYELQSFLSLSQEIVQKVMPFNASGEEIEVYIKKYHFFCVLLLIM